MRFLPRWSWRNSLLYRCPSPIQSQPLLKHNPHPLTHSEQQDHDEHTEKRNQNWNVSIKIFESKRWRWFPILRVISLNRVLLQWKNQKNKQDARITRDVEQIPQLSTAFTFVSADRDQATTLSFTLIVIKFLYGNKKPSRICPSLNICIT